MRENLFRPARWLLILLTVWYLVMNVSSAAGQGLPPPAASQQNVQGEALSGKSDTSSAPRPKGVPAVIREESAVPDKSLQEETGAPKRKSSPDSVPVLAILSLVVSIITLGLAVLGFVVWLPKELRNVLDKARPRDQYTLDDLVGQRGRMEGEIRSGNSALLDVMKNPPVPPGQPANALGPTADPAVLVTEIRSTISQEADRLRNEIGRELQQQLTNLEKVINGLPDETTSAVKNQLTTTLEDLQLQIQQEIRRLEESDKGVAEEYRVELNDAFNSLKQDVSQLAGKLDDRWDHPSATTSLKTYYWNLVDQAEKNSRLQSTAGQQSTTLTTLDGICAHLVQVMNRCPPTLRDFVESYLHEMDRVLPRKPDFEDLKKAIRASDKKWSDHEYMRWRLGKDMEQLSNRPFDSEFVSARLLRWDGGCAVLDGMEHRFRELIAKAFQTGAKTSADGAQDVLRSLRSKIIDLVERVDKDFPRETLEFSEVNEHLAAILDCLDLQELPVGLCSEEFSSLRHVSVAEDYQSRYPRNTIVGLVRRGLREKSSGAVIHKAHVVVAKRPQ